MQSDAVVVATGGPLSRAVEELNRLARVSAFRRERRLRSRSLLHQADALLELVEECRMRGYRLVPAQVWTHVVRLIGGVDTALRDGLGINRHPDHVAEALFAVQRELMARSVEERRPRAAEIIPLFGDDPAADDPATGTA